MSGPIQALILAAGRSRRMGRFKPLLPLRGQTVLECSVESALLGGAERVLVVTGCRGAVLEVLLRRRWPERVRCVRNEAWAQSDMLRSVRTGAAALEPEGAFFLLPGDMPLVRPSTFSALLRAREESGAGLLFPIYRGRRGHPPLIDAALLPAILRYEGEGGLRGLWRRWERTARSVEVTDPGTVLDLDTRSDYEQMIL